MIEKHPLFLKRIAHRIKADKNGCWVWQGRFNKYGYGHFTTKPGERKKHHSPHRFVMSLICEIPKDFVVDHICRNRACCNPNHLRVVTKRQNALENSNGGGAKNLKKTHCDHGHEFNQENTYLRKRKNGNTNRVCRACVSRRTLAFYHKNLQSTV